MLLIFSLASQPAASIEDVPAAPVYAGVAISEDDPATEKQDVDVKKSTPSSTPLVSINTDILDMNWTGAMDLSEPMLRPAGIILPFLESYPIDNLEVKLRLLNLKF